MFSTVESAQKGVCQRCMALVNKCVGLSLCYFAMPSHALIFGPLLCNFVSQSILYTVINRGVDNVK